MNRVGRVKPAFYPLLFSKHQYYLYSHYRMKQIILIVLGITLSGISFAQEVDNSNVELTKEVNVDSLTQTIYEHSESLYDSYFVQKTNDSMPKGQLYDMLLECFHGYMKCMNQVDANALSNLKEKVRKLRPELEEAGIYFSNTGNNAKAYKYLENYLVIPRLPLYVGEQFPRNANYPAYVFNVAAGLHNEHDYKSAVFYLKEYIELGEKLHQQTCYNFLAMDLDIIGDIDQESSVLDEGIMNYPNDIDMLKQATQLYIKKRQDDKAEEMLNKALALVPNDEDLKLCKASIIDNKGNFTEALTIYKECYAKRPNDVDIKKRLAFCYYNYAGSLIDQSNSAQDAEQYKSLKSSAAENFTQAISLLEELERMDDVVKDDKRILAALSDAYLQVGRAEDATQMKQRAEQVNMVLNVTSGQDNEVPNFNEWYKPRLEKYLEEWVTRGEFEPAEAYANRVNSETRKSFIATKRHDLEREFLYEYSDKYNLKDLTIKPYDPDHETYRIQTPQGDLYIKVPLANDEAKNFKDSWNGVVVSNPIFRVDQAGNIRLATAQFVTPNGHSYLYDADMELTYGKVPIAPIRWNDEDVMADVEVKDNKKNVNEPEYVEALNVGESTVDVDIPVNKKNSNESAYVLIISNENYENVAKVPFANSDGKSFRKYCIDVLGIPDYNITYLENATLGKMIGAVEEISKWKNFCTNMIVYYSGHGLPDPTTGQSYLMSVDATPTNFRTSYKLSQFYSDLAANYDKPITVFLDACFSGAAKDGAVMDKSARGVIIKTTKETPTNNMVVFSACTGDETAYPYTNQKHGMFTYFLLKKLQEDKGKTTYKKLADYIQQQVMRTSRQVLGHVQTPTTYSSMADSKWYGMRLDK